jgi:hypothetical protein
MTDLYMPENAAELRDQVLRDIRLAAIDAGMAAPPVEPGTDWHYLATSLGEMGLMGFANIAADRDATNALTATGTDLDNIRAGLGLPVVAAASATGKIVVTATGSATLTTAHAFVYPNGKRGRPTGSTSLSAGDTEVAVTAIDTGTGTNLAGGETVRFVSPPVNVNTEAEVSMGEPLTGGTDDETDERKRDRILNVYRYKPAGNGSDSAWGRIRQIVLDGLGTVQDCYIYPALGGPSSCKIVPVKDFDIANADFSRALSSTGVATVRTYIQEKLGIPQENVVQTVADEAVDATVLLEIPNATTDGGSGLGWTDATPWPDLVVADGDKVSISTVTANDNITVSANTTTTPIANVAHVAWWSSADRSFYPALVTAVAGSAGAWVLTLDKPLVDSTGAGPQTGDYVSPDAQNLAKYGEAWVAMFRTLGPGENTSDVNRLPRAKRHPLTTAEDPCSISNAVLAKMARDFTEITDYEYGYRSKTTPTIPASVSGAPNILVPQRFGVYPL